MRFITSASLGSQNISSSLLAATYTATMVDAITTRLFAAGVSGSANYLAFITLQRLGTGSTYQVVPVSSASVELGTTAIALTTIPVPVDNTDVLKVYLQGSASDTTAPSLWTYFYGENLTYALGASAISASNIAGSALDNTVFKTGAISVGVISASAIGASNIGGSAFDSTLFKSNALGVGVLSASVIAASNIGGSAFDSTLFKSNALPVGVLAASVLAASNIGGSAINQTTIPTAVVNQVADGVWDEALSGHLTTGTAGKGLSDAQAAGDPWSTLLPGGYGTGTAGSIIGKMQSDIWSYASRTLTQTAAQITDAMSGSRLTIHRGDSLSLTVTGLGSIVGYTEIWFTVKGSRNDPDASSKIMLTAGSNLRRMEGVAPSSSDNGLITVSSCALGNLVISISACEMSTLVPGNAVYDYQWKNASGSIATLSSGLCVIEGDVTRATA